MVNAITLIRRTALTVCAVLALSGCQSVNSIKTTITKPLEVINPFKSDEPSKQQIALWRAIKSRNAHAVRAALTSRELANAPFRLETRNGDSQVQPPLIWAITENSSLEVIDALVKAGADVNVISENDGIITFPLAEAVNLNNLTTIEYLLSKGAVHTPYDGELLSSNKVSPFLHAVGYGSPEAVSIFIKFGADPNESFGSLTPVIYAIYNNKDLNLDVLLKSGANPNALYGPANDTPLHYAAASGNESMVSALLQYGADSSILNSNGLTPSRLAAKLGHTSVAEFLNTHAAGISRPQRELLDAILANDLSEVKRLANRSIINQEFQLQMRDGNYFTDVPLIRSIVVGADIEIIEALINAGADVNYVIEDGKRTTVALAEAVNENRLDVIRLLFRNGAILDPSPSKLNKNDKVSLLSHVAGVGSPEALLIFVQNGADPNKSYGGRSYALSVATRMEKIENVRILLENKADPNIRIGANGDTPLHYAVTTRNFSIIRLLLEAGANPSLRDIVGKTAEELARSEADGEDVANFIRDFKATPAYANNSNTPQRNYGYLPPNQPRIIERHFIREVPVPAPATRSPYSPPSSHTTDSKSARLIFSQLSPSVVKIIAPVVEMKNGKYELVSSSQGSGVAITKSVLLTNHHVVEESNIPFIRLNEDSEPLFLEVAFCDEKLDVCAMQLEEAVLKPVTGHKSIDDVYIGDTVYAIGSPHGLDNTLSDGLVSGKREIKGSAHVQFTADISPGSSGGGLFDEEGRLIAITTFLMKEGNNLNFAVPAKPYVDRILRTYR